MATDRKLINYLPNYMQEYDEMAGLMEVEQPEVDSLWNAVENALADQFVMDATENGVMRWEKILKVFPKATETLDERKFRIIALMNQKLPYTMRSLEQVLTQLCGADGYSITLKVNEYCLEVKLALGNHSNYEEVKNMLSAMIPANLVGVITLMFVAHETVASYTHRKLSAFTHNQIRNEVLN